MNLRLPRIPANQNAPTPAVKKPANLECSCAGRKIPIRMCLRLQKSANQNAPIRQVLNKEDNYDNYADSKLK